MAERVADYPRPPALVAVVSILSSAVPTVVRSPHARSMAPPFSSTASSSAPTWTRASSTRPVTPSTASPKVATSSAVAWSSAPSDSSAPCAAHAVCWMPAAMEVQPWHGAVMAPTQAKEDAPSAAPEAELELEWVHGYSGQVRRSNVAFSAHGAVVGAMNHHAAPDVQRHGAAALRNLSATGANRGPIVAVGGVKVEPYGVKQKVFLSLGAALLPMPPTAALVGASAAATENVREVHQLLFPDGGAVLVVEHQRHLNLRHAPLH